MSELQVTPEQLRETSQLLSDKANRIEQRLETLAGRADELFGDGWQGSAAAAYADGMVEWRDGVGEVVAALRRSAALLAGNAESYRAREESNTEWLTGI